jgi:hypothetical protein
VDAPVAAAAEAAGELAGAELAGAELAGAELAGAELELELQAAAPTSRQAPTAAMRHLEPALIRRDIPVKRIIAPCRLSAVNGEPSTFCLSQSIGRPGLHQNEEGSSRSGPSSARRGRRRRRTELIDQ